MKLSKIFCRICKINEADVWAKESREHTNIPVCCRCLRSNPKGLSKVADRRDIGY